MLQKPQNESIPILIPSRTKSPEETIDYTPDVSDSLRKYQTFYETTPIRDQYEPSVISLPNEGRKVGKAFGDLTIPEKILVYRELAKNEDYTLFGQGISGQAVVAGTSMIIGAGKLVSEVSIINPITGKFQIPYRNTPSSIYHTVFYPEKVYASLASTEGVGELAGSVILSSALTLGISSAIKYYYAGQTSPPRGYLEAEGNIDYSYPNEPRYVRDYGIYKVDTETLSATMESPNSNLYSLKESSPESYSFTVSGKGYRSTTVQNLATLEPELYTYIQKDFLGGKYDTFMITNAETGSSRFITMRGNKIVNEGEFIGMNEFAPTEIKTIDRGKVSIYEVNEESAFSQLAEKQKTVEYVESFGSSKNVDYFRTETVTGINEERIVSSQNPYFFQQGTYTLDITGKPTFEMNTLEITPAKFEFIASNENPS
jgi:hypothetical protein